MKPCIAYAHNGRIFAWDEHGRMLCQRSTWVELNQRVRSLGYAIAHPRSNFASNVRDRMRYKYPSLAQEAGR